MNPELCIAVALMHKPELAHASEAIARVVVFRQTCFPTERYRALVGKAWLASSPKEVFAALAGTPGLGAFRKWFVEKSAPIPLATAEEAAKKLIAAAGLPAQLRKRDEENHTRQARQPQAPCPAI